MSDSEDRVPDKKEKLDNQFCKTHSTNLNRSSQLSPEIFDVIIKFINDQITSDSKPTILFRVDNSTSESSQLYQRHQEVVNERGNDSMKCQKNSHQYPAVSEVQNELKQVTQKTSVDQEHSNSSINTRQKRYYERHKDKISEQRRDKRLKQSLKYSNHNIIQKIAQNFTSTTHHTNIQQFKEIKNERNQATTETLPAKAEPPPEVKRILKKEPFEDITISPGVVIKEEYEVEDYSSNYEPPEVVSIVKKEPFKDIAIAPDVIINEEYIEEGSSNNVWVAEGLI